MNEIVQNIPTDEWRRFLEDCRNATLFHSPEWRTFLERTFGYTSHSLFARDPCGQVTGMMPLFEVKSRITGNRLVSVPFAHECSPLGPLKDRIDLVAAAMDVHERLDTRSLELRTGVAHPAFISYNQFSTFILPLSTEEDAWGSIHRSAKRYIKKSLEKVNVTESNTEADAAAFYQINCLNKRRKGVPAHPEVFFKNLTALFPEAVHIYLAWLDHEPIGGVITLDSGRCGVLYGYGASDPAYLDYSPLYASLWKSIEDACRRQRDAFDFGRVSSDNTGLISFKKRWGARERRLDYCYYPSNRPVLSGKRDTPAFRMASAVVRHMPLSAYKLVSDRVFRHFG